MSTRVTNVCIKDGKLTKSTQGMSVSKRIAQRKSIKTKPVRRTAK